MTPNGISLSTVLLSVVPFVLLLLENFGSDAAGYRVSRNVPVYPEREGMHLGELCGVRFCDLR